jgi:enoyl-CoA hydratase/carnithine racemase
MIEIEEKGTVRIMRMNNGKDNRFNIDFVAALNDALDEIENDAGAKAVVVTAAQEKYFSNGIDLEWVMKNGAGAMAGFFPGFLKVLDRFLMFPKPIVAAINGHAFAGGFFFSMTADYRIMRDDKGWMCANEIDLGFPLCKGLLILPTYSLGNRLAERVVMTGERFTAPQALGLGIIDETAAPDTLIDKAVEKATFLGMKNPEKYAEFKRDMRAGASEIILYDVENYVVPAG